MTVKEFYDSIGGDYDEAANRLMNDMLIKRFVTKFLSDLSYQHLVETMEKEDYEEAFAAAHTLKGVCKNLAFHAIGDSSSHITELLRTKQYEEAAAYLPTVKEDYNKIISSIPEIE